VERGRRGIKSYLAWVREEQERRRKSASSGEAD
jgi:hypothetical protein